MDLQCLLWLNSPLIELQSLLQLLQVNAAVGTDSALCAVSSPPTDPPSFPHSALCVREICKPKLCPQNTTCIQTAGLLTLNPPRPFWRTSITSSILLENSMDMLIHQHYTSLDQHYSSTISAWTSTNQHKPA